MRTRYPRGATVLDCLKLRAGATRLRTYADTLRETACDGKAAANDKRADRMEARAAAMVS